MKLRAYSGPLTVLITGILGFSLFCIVSAAALADPRVPNASGFEPQDIVDSAINNINTMAALTMEAVSQYIPTLTMTPSSTQTATLTEVPPTGTPTIKPSSTRLPPTKTRDPQNPAPTSTRTPVPTRTNTPIPTYTVPPSATNTPVPPETDTNTPIPTDTNTVPPATPIPSDTNTPEPSPTNLPIPA